METSCFVLYDQPSRKRIMRDETGNNLGAENVRRHNVVGLDRLDEDHLAGHMDQIYFDPTPNFFWKCRYPSSIGTNLHLVVLPYIPLFGTFAVNSNTTLGFLAIPHSCIINQCVL
jgi:hypothetical protein